MRLGVGYKVGLGSKVLLMLDMLHAILMYQFRNSYGSIVYMETYRFYTINNGLRVRAPAKTSMSCCLLGNEGMDLCHPCNGPYNSFPHSL